MYELQEPVSWDIGKKNSGYTIEFNIGDTFDISVPKPLRCIYSPHDKQVLLAALVHDWLVKNKFDIAFSSSEFRRCCVARGVPRWKAWGLFFVTFFYLTTKDTFNRFK